MPNTLLALLLVVSLDSPLVEHYAPQDAPEVNIHRDVVQNRITFPLKTLSLADPFEQTINEREAFQKLRAPGDTINLQINRILSEIAESNKSFTKTSGYRIQVYSGTDRRQALHVFDTLKEVIEMQSYYIFERPYHKVKIGDFISKIEAYKFYISISEIFEDAIIVLDEIKILKKPYDPDKEEEDDEKNERQDHEFGREEKNPSQPEDD